MESVHGGRHSRQQSQGRNPIVAPVSPKEACQGRDFHSFLVAPRVHLAKLLAVVGPMEGSRPTVRALEGLDSRVRNVAGRPADHPKTGVPGLSKLKVPGVSDFVDRPTRRLVREVSDDCSRPFPVLNLCLQGKMSSFQGKKKASDLGYWLCDDAFFWGAVKGPVKGCVRLLFGQLASKKLDEGGWMVELGDSQTGQSVDVFCADEASRTFWEQDLQDWISHSFEAERRRKVEEQERILHEAEERARLQAEQVRMMEAEREAIAARRAEEDRRLAEIERRRLEDERLAAERRAAEIARGEVVVEGPPESLAVPPPLQPPPPLQTPPRQLSPRAVVKVAPPPPVRGASSFFSLLIFFPSGEHAASARSPSVGIRACYFSRCKATRRSTTDFTSPAASSCPARCQLVLLLLLLVVTSS